MSYSSTLVQTRPNASQCGVGTTFSTGSNTLVDVFNEGKSADFAALRDTFGLLLGKPKSDLCTQATTVESFMCHMNVFDAYKTKEWPIFGDFVTAQILNSRNSFLLALSPLLETPEVNFTIERTVISSMPFTEIAPCGIAEELSAGSYTYSFKQTVRQYEQSCTIERNLILDPNFGQQIWLKTLAYFVANARLTIDMGIITTLVQTGYENMTRSLVEGSPIDPDKLYFAINNTFLLAAVDPEQFIDSVRNLEAKIPDLDTLIIPAGKSAYLRGVGNDGMTMLVQKLSTDASSNEVMVKFAEGPDSFKTVKLGNRILHIIEFQPFFLGDKEPMRINPLMTRLVIGQFYPPNPFLRPEFCASKKYLCGETTDTTIFQQTKKNSVEQAITLKTRLENAFYWNKHDGKVSQAAKNFARQQTQTRRLQPGGEPWDWNDANPNYEKRNADVNEETTSNSEPDMAEIACKIDIREMKSWRDEFAGLLYDPETKTFIIPPHFGDYPRRSIPDDYIKMDAEILEAKLKEQTGHSPEESFIQIRKLGERLRDAEWRDDFLYAFLDKNIGRMVAFNQDTGFTIETVKTPLVREEKNSTKNGMDRCKYASAEIIEEAKGNRFGGWDLPDKPETMLQEYPPGFASGAGIRTLAQEVHKEGSSLWAAVGKEAMEALDFAETLVKFIREYIGKTAAINPRLLAPWYHKTSAVTMLLDRIIGTAGPVHIGIPDSIQFSDTNVDQTVDVPVTGPTERVEIAPNLSLLRDTVADTANAIKAATLANTRREIINNATRALACLYDPAYTKLRGIDVLIDSLGGDDFFKTDMVAILHQFYDITIRLCSNNTTKSEQTAAVQIVSIITEAFVDQLQSYVTPLTTQPDDNARAKYRTTILRGMKSFIANFNNDTTIRKFLNTEKARREKARGPECVDFGEGFHDELMAYEKPVGCRGTPINIARGTGAYPEASIKPVFKVDYTQPPAKYIRAPIPSSPALREFLRDKPFGWIIPSDSATFYATPEDIRIMTSNSAICDNPHANKLELCSLGKSLTVQCQLNSRLPGSSKSNVATASHLNVRDSDLFSPLRSAAAATTTTSRSTQSHTPLNMGQFLSMGQFRGEDDCQASEDPSYASVSRKSKSFRQPYITPSGDIDLLNNNLRVTYPGPWKKRLHHIHHSINNEIVKFFALAILEAPNTSDAPIKLSSLGAVLLDAIIIRPFIELRTSAAIAMKAGRSTMITTIGHSHVQVTKESRGCWHINVGFFMGLIKIENDNVALIPNAFPESLIGGKDTNFMTNLANLNFPNPVKESALSMLVSADERQIDGPIHITNGPAAYRANIDYAIHLRKHSAGKWMEFLLGPTTVRNIDAANINRETYATCLKSSNILDQGPASYINPRTGMREDVEGNGAMGQFIMNQPGVNQVYEGIAKRFGDRLQMYTYRRSNAV